jgi:hypothetical protein
MEAAEVWRTELPTTPRLAFGDESCGADAVTYALAVIESEKLAAIEEGLRNAKRQFGATCDTVLHCRELFSGHARKKGDWKHLDLTSVVALYNAVLDVALPQLHSAIVCFAALTDMPAEIGQIDDTGPTPPMPGTKTGLRKFGEKEIASFCARGCMIPFLAEHGRAVTLIALPEASKIRTFGNSEQFDRTIRGFVDRGSTPVRFEATNDSPSAGMLEIADCFAYFPQKSLMISNNPSYVEANVRSLRDRVPYKRVRLHFPNGHMAMEVIAGLSNVVSDAGDSVPKPRTLGHDST